MRRKFIPILTLTCALCGKEFQRKDNLVGKGKHYCGKTCSARASNKPRQPKYPMNTNVFQNEDTNSFYLLGAYLTDGHVNRYNIAITSKDKDWLELIRDMISPNHPVYEDSRKNCFKLECSTGGPNSPVLQWFKSYGCKKRKSLTLRLTKSIPSQYRADLLRGIIDGDGCIYYGEFVKNTKNKLITTRIERRVEVSIASASLGFMKDLKNLLPEFDLTIKREKARSSIIRGKPLIPTKKYNYKLVITGTKAIEFLKWVYYSNHQLAMPRKQQKAKWIIDNVVFDGIRKIQPISKKVELVCLQCQKTVMITPSQQKRGRQCCSRDCQYQYALSKLWPSDNELIALREKHSVKEMVDIIGISIASIYRKLEMIKNKK